MAAALLDIPVLGKLSSAFLNRKYAKLGFNLAKTIPDEIGNSHRLCANTDFDFNTKCLSLIGDKRIPVLIGYGLDDLFIEHAIFNELSTILRLPTLDEMARLNEAKSNYFNLKYMISNELINTYKVVRIKHRSI